MSAAAVSMQKGLTALKDGMDRYRLTVKDSKFQTLRKKCDACLSGFGRASVDDCIALACESIAAANTDAIIRAALDILEVVISYELTKDSKATGNILRAICKTPRGRPDDLTHKLLRNLSRCEVHHFVEITVFEQIASTLFELLNSSAVSSTIDASCKAGLAHLLANRLARYEQPREESETDAVVGTPDYVAAVILMKATEVEANRADTFFEVVHNLFRECPHVLVQPKSANLVLRHVLPRCAQRPKHPIALSILGSVVSIFGEQAYPYAEIIFKAALLPAMKERQTAVDAMTVFLDIARKPAVLSGLLAYYDCSEGGARCSLVQQWIAAVCAACASAELRPIRASLALLLQLFVDFFASLPDKDALKQTLGVEAAAKKKSNNNNYSNGHGKQHQEPSSSATEDNNNQDEHIEQILARSSELIRNCEANNTVINIARIFNAGDFKGFLKEGIRTGHIASDSAADQSLFIYRNRLLLDKLRIGEYLAKRERKDILSGYVHNFDFRHMHIDQGIRRLMGTYKIVGEADIVDRTTDYFAARYCQQNPGVYSCESTAGILAFSTMMLNTDQHSPNVKVKMQKFEFVKNNRGIDNGKDLPKEMLEGVYERIQAEEIVLDSTLEQLTPTQAAAKVRELYGELNKLPAADAWSGSAPQSAAAAAAAGSDRASTASGDGTAAVLASPPAEDTSSSSSSPSAPPQPAPAASSLELTKTDTPTSQQQKKAPAASDIVVPAVFDSRISHILIGGTIENFTTAVAQLVVTDTSREAAVKTISRLIKLTCVLDLRSALKSVVGQLCAVCKETKYTAALRMSALNLLVDSVLEYSGQFQSCWFEVAEALAACGVQFAKDAAASCERLSNHMVGETSATSKQQQQQQQQQQSQTGDNLCAYLLGFLQVLTTSKVTGDWFLSADSFLTQAVLRAVTFVCSNSSGNHSHLWRDKIFSKALPMLKQAVFTFPTNQCADTLDRICTASLGASAQCTAFILFVCREFSVKNPFICGTFLTTASLIDISRCDDADFERLVAVYDTLGRAPQDADLRARAFDAFRASMIAKPVFVESLVRHSSSKQPRAAMALRVAATFAKGIPAGTADDALFECCATLVQSVATSSSSSSSNNNSKDQLMLQTSLLAASCIASLVTLGGSGLERRQTALQRLFTDLYHHPVLVTSGEGDSIKAALVSNVFVPLFETLTDQVAMVEALHWQKQQQGKGAAAQQQSQQPQGEQAEQAGATTNGGGRGTGGTSTPRGGGGGAATPAGRPRAGSGAGRGGAATPGSPGITPAGGGGGAVGGSPTVVGRARGQSTVSASAAAAAAGGGGDEHRSAAKAHVELATRIFNNCAPLSKPAVLTPYETVFLLCALKHSLRSLFNETQAIGMNAIKDLSRAGGGVNNNNNNNNEPASENNNGRGVVAILSAEAWSDVTDLIVDILATTSASFLHGDVMGEHHTRYWTPLLYSVAMHAGNPSAPSPLVGKKLSGAFADLLAVCARASARNAHMLDFERDVLRIGSQVAAAAQDFDRVGTMASLVSTAMLEQQEKMDRSTAARNATAATTDSPASPASPAAAVVVSQRQQTLYAHAVKSATLFVEWAAHIDGADVFVSVVRAAYPSLCDMVKCGNATLGGALSMVFHRLAPVVHKK